jgi:ketosteroid isomerase-like protein
VPSIEIIDSRIKAWRIKLADTVADNGSSASVVVAGRPTRLADVDLRDTDAVLYVNDEPVERGNTNAVLPRGGPGRPSRLVRPGCPRRQRRLRARRVRSSRRRLDRVRMTTVGSARAQMEATIRTYFDGCNEADAEKMRSCLADDAVHYFPAGAPQGPFVGAEAIARGWREAVGRLDSRWTVDHVLVDEERREAVIEWTHFKPATGAHLRGDEWYRFDEDGLITEIRAYYACPPGSAPQNHELGGFDYAGRGYPLVPPAVRRRGDRE